MTRHVAEWHGKTDNDPIPDRVKVRIFGRDNGRCKVCTRKVGIGGEPFAFDHRVALVNGGEHTESNIQLLCTTCHKSKTAEDVAIKSRVYVRRKADIGIRKPSRMPGSRNSKWKRKIDGTVVLREM